MYDLAHKSFLKKLVHDLNSPLTALEIALVKMTNRQQFQEALRLATAANRQIQKTLLSFLAKSDSKPEGLLVSDIKEIISDIALTLGIEGQLLASIDPVIEAHAFRQSKGDLHRILLNLLKNAKDASFHGEPIKCQISISNGVFEIQVVDSGCGINLNNLPFIFDSGFTTKGGLGAGIGLSITKTLVEKYGGKIQICSQVGYGTSAKVTWCLTP